MGKKQSLDDFHDDFSSEELKQIKITGIATSLMSFSSKEDWDSQPLMIKAQFIRAAATMQLESTLFDVFDLLGLKRDPVAAPAPAPAPAPVAIKPESVAIKPESVLPQTPPVCINEISSKPSKRVDRREDAIRIQNYTKNTGCSVAIAIKKLNIDISIPNYYNIVSKYGLNKNQQVVSTNKARSGAKQVHTRDEIVGRVKRYVDANNCTLTKALLALGINSSTYYTYLYKRTNTST